MFQGNNCEERNVVISSKCDIINLFSFPLRISTVNERRNKLHLQLQKGRWFDLGKSETTSTLSSALISLHSTASINFFLTKISKVNTCHIKLLEFTQQQAFETRPPLSFNLPIKYLKLHWSGIDFLPQKKIDIPPLFYPKNQNFWILRYNIRFGDKKAYCFTLLTFSTKIKICRLLFVYTA